MAKKRIYISLDDREMALLDRVASLQARCRAHMAAKIVRDKIFTMADLDRELADWLRQWENENFGRTTWQARLQWNYSAAAEQTESH